MSSQSGKRSEVTVSTMVRSDNKSGMLTAYVLVTRKENLFSHFEDS